MATEKRSLSYDELKVIAKNIANSIKNYGHDEYHLVAVSRGGVTLGHLVAYQLAKPLYFYTPGSPNTESVPNSGVLIFLEDLIAKGRTLASIKSNFYSREYWVYPTLVDTAYCINPEDRLITEHSLITSEWVVFPWEDYDKVKPGDWGLFREGTSNNSRMEK